MAGLRHHAISMRRQTIRERLETGFQILETIRMRRLETGSPKLGWAVEKAIIDRELQDLERDLAPEALARVRIRPVEFPPDIRLGGRSSGLDLAY